MKDTMTLWLPTGYGIGSVIKDIEGQYWEATSHVTGSIFEIEMLSNEVAELKIKNGCSLLVSK